MEHYNEKNEKQLLELVQQKQESDKRLLHLEIVIGILSIFILLSMTFIAAFVEMDTWHRIVLIVCGFLFCCIGLVYAILIEQIAGYYECQKCHHKYVPTYKSVLFSMHVNRTRYMKCPECHQKSWQKKVLTKD